MREYVNQDVKNRTLGIGGSDVHNILMTEPYSCNRKLYYEKKGVKPTFPFTGNNATERGNKLEEIAAREYAETTGRKLRKSNKTTILDFFMTANVDRYIDKVEGKEGRGVLEIKVPGEFMFKKIKREGLPNSYVLQLQHYLMVTGCQWGSFAIFWADGFEMLTFDVCRDEELIGDISHEEAGFWSKVVDEEIPDKPHQSYEDVCRKCPFRVECHGSFFSEEVVSGDETNQRVEFDDSMSELKDQYLEAKELKEESATYFDGKRAELIGVMGDRKNVKVQEAYVKVNQVVSNILDTKSLVKKIVADKGQPYVDTFYKQSSYKTLTVKCAKKSKEK